MSDSVNSENSESSPTPEFDEKAFEDAVGISPLEEDAAHMHELFLSFMKAGFLEHQALRLVAMLIDQANETTIVFTSEEDDDDDEED